jgi:AraC family transcriptional regulator, L-rhamnose operon transcriptional activator RhaR
VHLVLDCEVFGADRPSVVAEYLHLTADSPPHGHGFIEIAVVVRGSAVHRSAHGGRCLTPGSVLLLRPGQWHGYEDADGLELWNVYIGSDVLARELLGFQSDPVLAPLLWAVLVPSAQGAAEKGSRNSPPDPLLGVLHGDGLARTTAALCELAEYTAPAPAARIARLGRLLILLSHLGALIPPSAPSPRVTTAIDPRIVEARQLLEAHLGEPWTLAALAAHVHVSPGHLSRRFRSALGSPPLEYLSRRRAEWAAKLLIETDISVAEIGRIVGWPDPNYMTRRFKLIMGLTPTAYRSAFSPVPSACHERQPFSQPAGAEPRSATHISR